MKIHENSKGISTIRTIQFGWANELLVGDTGVGNFPGRIELSMPGVLLGGGARGAIAIASERHGAASLCSVPQFLMAHRSASFVLKTNFK